MSLVVSSTTDSQEAVNAAAGITDAGAATAPAEPTESPAESQPPQPTTPEEPKPEEEEPEPDEQEDTGEPKEPAKKKGGFQRKIERLERMNEYAVRRNQELEAALAAQKPAGEKPRSQEPPRMEQFTDPDEYYDARAEWKFKQLREQEAREAAKRQAQEQEQQLKDRWDERADSFAETNPDFYEVLRATSRYGFAYPVHEALMDSEIGPRLAYELARQPKEMERLSKLPTASAIREIGKHEARLSSSSESSEGAKPVAHTKAPPPIRPVGGGGPTTTKRPDEMPFQEYKAWRKKHGAR